MKIKYYSFCLCMLVILSGCSINNADDHKETVRTYPYAFNFDFSTVLKLKNEVNPPDSLNVVAFVKSVIVCPKDASCFVPDGIVISDSLDPKTTVSEMHLMVKNPRQLKEDSLYQFSIQIDTYPNGDKKFELLGYSPLTRYDDL